MTLHKLVRRNYGEKSPVRIKYQSLHSFKEGVILLCHSILETRKVWEAAHGNGVRILSSVIIVAQSDTRNIEYVMG